MDPIQAMHTHGAMPDDDYDALFAVTILGIGVKSHPEGMEEDAGEEDGPQPEPKKRKDAPTLLHMMLSRKKHSFIFTLTQKQEDKLLESSRCLPLLIAHDYTTNS